MATGRRTRETAGAAGPPPAYFCSRCQRWFHHGAPAGYDDEGRCLCGTCKWYGNRAPRKGRGRKDNKADWADDEEGSEP